MSLSRSPSPPLVREPSESPEPFKEATWREHMTAARREPEVIRHAEQDVHIYRHASILPDLPERMHGARTQAPLPIRMYLPESDIYIGPGQELWADLDLVPDPVIEGFQEVAVNININPRPEICRSFYFPRSRREQLRLVNADLDNPAAMLEKEKYWTQVLEGREVFFPMGFYHWVFPRVMLSFAPSGIYHTNMWCRLQELKKWVAHHTTWRQATAASAHITVYAYIPPRMLYVLFALGTPVRKGPRREDVDIIHFTFSQEVAQLIKDTHLHFMIPNLAGVFNDKPEDWVNSDTF